MVYVIGQQSLLVLIEYVPMHLQHTILIINVLPFKFLVQLKLMEDVKLDLYAQQLQYRQPALLVWMGFHVIGLKQFVLLNNVRMLQILISLINNVNKQIQIVLQMVEDVQFKQHVLLEQLKQDVQIWQMEQNVFGLEQNVKQKHV